MIRPSPQALPEPSGAPAPRSLRWLEGLLWGLAAVLLGSYFGALAEAELVQAQHARRLDAHREMVTEAVSSAATVQAVDLDKAPSELANGLVGRIRIEGADVESIVLSGEDDLTLRRAVGHLADTALPGQGGNVALAAHRDSFFRGLRHVEAGQHIEIETLDGTYHYVVTSTRVVEPTDLSVLEDTGAETLTLITCYPFDYVGPAPRRFVVRASRVAARPVTQVTATASVR
jgi:sortase A